jgi:hypothetical protein
VAHALDIKAGGALDLSRGVAIEKSHSMPAKGLLGVLVRLARHAVEEVAIGTHGVCHPKLAVLAHVAGRSLGGWVVRVVHSLRRDELDAQRPHSRGVEVLELSVGCTRQE